MKKSFPHAKDTAKNGRGVWFGTATYRVSRHCLTPGTQGHVSDKGCTYSAHCPASLACPINSAGLIAFYLSPGFFSINLGLMRFFGTGTLGMTATS